MKIYKATSNDIEDLIRLRMDFLKTEFGELNDEAEEEIRSQIEAYFIKHISLGDFIAAIARTEIGEIVSTAFLTIQEQPASPSFLSGKTATLLNVLTYPQYRRQGIATKIINYLLNEAKGAKVSIINLAATEDGKYVYEKLGFNPLPYTSMRLTL